MRIRSLLFITMLALLLAACAPVQPAAPAGPAADAPVLTVMTHDSFNVSEDVVAKFQAQCGCKVQFLKSGDAGLMLNKAILSKSQPQADVMYGVDNTFLSRALREDLFEAYASPALAGIPDDLKLDPDNRLLPVDYGYVTLNYDKAAFGDDALPVPQTLPRSGRSALQREADRREPGHVVARPGLPVDHHRGLR